MSNAKQILNRMSDDLPEEMTTNVIRGFNKSN